MAYTTTKPGSYSIYAIIAFTVLALGLMRAALLVVHEPVLGYGDRADMHLTADCFGLDAIADPRRAGESSRPNAEYHTAGIKWSGCYPSSSVIFGAPVVLAYGIASIVSMEPEILIPLKAFGLFNLLLFALLSLAIALWLRRFPIASVVHAALFFLLIADPVSTLWLNTLYSEPAALLGAYGAAGMTSVIVLEGGTRRRLWWLLAASLATLGLAREQFGLLPLLLAALAWPALKLRSRPRARMMLIVGAAVAIAQVAMIPLRPDYIRPIHRVNAYLGVILPASQDESATLDHLGLPQRCANMSGASWTQRRGENLEVACPEVIGLSSMAFLKLLPTEPLTLLRAVSRVLPAAQSVVPGYLGLSAEGPILTVSDLPPRVMSFIALLSSTSSMVFAGIIMTLLVSFPLALAWLLWTVKNEPELAALPTAFLLLIAIGGYTLLTTALGYGIVGAERHNWLGAMATLGAVILLPLMVRQLSRDLLRARVALAAAFGVALLAAGWLLWARQQPLAIGVLEKVGEGKSRVLEVSGWALDPWGIRRVFATVGGGPQSEGTRGIERRDLQANYPGYPEAIGGGFQMSIPSSGWRENEMLRIFVENRAGAIAEVDRRVIRLHP